MASKGRAQQNTPHILGGNQINYKGEVGTPTGEMLLVKILLNRSVVSTPGAKFMCLNISDFYLETPLLRPEYVKLKLQDKPDKIIKEYNLGVKATSNGCVYVKVQRSMYGLPQAGLLSNEMLERRLAPYGYYQVQQVPDL